MSKCEVEPSESRSISQKQPNKVKKTCQTNKRERNYTEPSGTWPTSFIDKDKWKTMFKVESLTFLQKEATETLKKRERKRFLGMLFNPLDVCPSHIIC